MSRLSIKMDPKVFSDSPNVFSFGSIKKAFVGFLGLLDNTVSDKDIIDRFSLVLIHLIKDRDPEFSKKNYASQRTHQKETRLIFDGARTIAF